MTRGPLTRDRRPQTIDYRYQVDAPFQALSDNRHVCLLRRTTKDELCAVRNIVAMDGTVHWTPRVVAKETDDSRPDNPDCK